MRHILIVLVLLIFIPASRAQGLKWGMNIHVGAGRTNNLFPPKPSIGAGIYENYAPSPHLLQSSGIQLEMIKGFYTENQTGYQIGGAGHGTVTTFPILAKVFVTQLHAVLPVMVAWQQKRWSIGGGVQCGLLFFNGESVDQYALVGSHPFDDPPYNYKLHYWGILDANIGSVLQLRYTVKDSMWLSLTGNNLQEPFIVSSKRDNPWQILFGISFPFATLK